LIFENIRRPVRRENPFSRNGIRPDSRRSIRSILSDVLDSEDNLDNTGEIFSNIERRNTRPMQPPRLPGDFMRAYREIRSAINRTTQQEPGEQNDNNQVVQTYEEPGKKTLRNL
jgi:hypothetical protein